MTITELTLDAAWQMISERPDSVMIDVRTSAEWAYVGQPDLRSLGKQLRSVEWTTFPTGARNPGFVTDATADLDPGQPVLLICRSGTRSRAAAVELVRAGFTDVHNVTDGFEGDLDHHGRRTTGWKGAGLPWRQN